MISFICAGINRIFFPISTGTFNFACKQIKSLLIHSRTDLLSIHFRFDN